METNLSTKSKEELIEIIESLFKDKDSLTKEKLTLTAKIQEVEFNLKKLQNLLFNKKTEKLSFLEDKQAKLFNEAELFNHLKTEENKGGVLPEAESNSKDENKDDKEEIPEETVKVATYSRKKPGRSKISEALPRVDRVVDLPEDEKYCACGSPLTKIGEETSEKLEIIPMQVFVNRTIRPKYACKCCNGNHEDVTSEIKSAKLPPQFIPKSLGDIGLISYSLIAKFNDGLPFYRLSNIFSRYGCEISRSTLCNYVIQSHENLKYIDDEFWREIKNSPYLQIDETPVKVNKVDGKKKDTMSYMFVIRALIRGKPVIRYLYSPTRSVKFLMEYLKDYKGVIQTDGWRSYDFHFLPVPSIVHAGCWNHARREFVNILKVSVHHKGCLEFVRLIGELYKIEKTIRTMSPEERLKVRQSESREIINQIRRFLDSESLTNLHNTPYGKALKYLARQWDKLLVFLNHPDLLLDTNLVENAIRPFVIGRKNWLFSDTDTGAEASAFFYSLIETAKANKIEPYAFLKQFITAVQDGKNPEYFGWVY